MPKIRFSVVSFAPPGAALAVLGSTESLGKWDVQRAKKLEARLGRWAIQFGGPEKGERGGDLKVDG